MSYRQARSSRGRSSSFSPKYNKSYASQQSGSRRHQFVTDAKGPSGSTNAASLAANEYAIIDLMRFQRTFDISVTVDSPPTATASNNYQTPAVFNGSRCVRYSGKVRIENTGGSTNYYDVYEVALSFYDALIWETISSAGCMVDFETTGATFNQGAVTSKTPTSTRLITNTYKNFKFTQHYMKHRGTVSVGSVDAATNVAEITLNFIPPKVRRSQTGMYWGLILHNPSDKNQAGTLTQIISAELSFEEIPSDNRLPYID